MWYQWSYPKEFEQMETNFYQVYDNEDEFLRLYHNFYEKQNINEKSKKTEQELLKYIDDLEIDLLASSFVGLSRLYLIAFVGKVDIYVSDLEWKMAYYMFKPYHLTKEQMQSYYDFFKDYKKFLFFINKLDDDMFIVPRLYGNFFVFKFFGHLLPLTEEKCFMKNDILDTMRKSYDEIQQINNRAFNNKFAHKALNIAQNIYSETKDKLNECN